MSMADNVAGANGLATNEGIQESLRQTAALLAELREQSKETDRRLKKAEGLFTRSTSWR